MTAQIGEYADYKDSGVTWLGEIPAHWEVRRNGGLFAPVKQTGFPGLPILEVSLRTGVQVRDLSDMKRKQFMNDASDYQRALAGDLVYNTMRMWQGAVGVAPIDGLVSPAYVVARPYKGQNSRYYELLFRTPGYQREVDGYSRGIVKDRNQLYWEQLKGMFLPCPPVPEQVAIVKYLAHVDRKIDRFIRSKRRMIELLNEQKQAIIHQAVTRGLDPFVPMKDSGVEWLGEIPAHWTTSRLKYVASHIVDCLHATPLYSPSGDYPAIRTADIEPGIVNVSGAKRIGKDQFELWTSRLAPQAGDVLYSREGERFGIAASVPEDTQLCISQRMMVFRIAPSHSSSYFMWQLNAPVVYAQASVDTLGAAAPHVNIETIKNFRLMVPLIAEQREITDRIAAELIEIDQAILRVNQEIELIREYRTRLISDVVTGKVDVRAAAAMLPEVDAESGEIGFDGDEAVDEMDESIDDEGVE